MILDHTAFVISAVGEHMEEADIGWRPAYIPTSYACEVIPFSPELLDANGLPNRNYYLYMDFVEPSVIDVSELTGRWEEFAYIVEGTYGKPQDWEMQYLNFNADGSVTLEKRDVDHADLTAYTLTKTEDDYGGRPCYSVKIYESEEKHTMYRLNDDRLEVSVDWTYSDGTPGGCNIIYHRVTE